MLYLLCPDVDDCLDGDVFVGDCAWFIIPSNWKTLPDLLRRCHKQNKLQKWILPVLNIKCPPINSAFILCWSLPRLVWKFDWYIQTFLLYKKQGNTKLYFLIKKIYGYNLYFWVFFFFFEGERVFFWYILYQESLCLLFFHATSHLDKQLLLAGCNYFVHNKDCRHCWGWC